MMDANQFDDTYDTIVDMLWENEGMMAVLLPSLDGREGLGLVITEVPLSKEREAYHHDEQIKGRLHASLTVLARKTFNDVLGGEEFDSFTRFAESLEQEDDQINFDPDFDLNDDE